MKKYLILLIFLSQQICFSQWSAISLVSYTESKLSNKDYYTRRMLDDVSENATLRLVLEVIMASSLESSESMLTEILDKKYTKNTYDTSNSFITSSVSSAAMALGTTALSSSWSSGYYMTKNKREYMDSFNLDKTVLLALQTLDYDNITTGNRQEIYRLRREIAKEYSKNDAEIMQLLLLPAVRQTAEGSLELATLIKTLEMLE